MDSISDLQKQYAVCIAAWKAEKALRAMHQGRNEGDQARMKVGKMRDLATRAADIQRTIARMRAPDNLR